MHRTLLLSLLLFTACSKSSDAPKPTPFSHTKPVFTIDLPPDFKPSDPLEQGDHGMLRFDGPHASDFLMVSWEPAQGETATAERDSLVSTSNTMGNEKVTGQGETAGGASWETSSNAMGNGIEAYLVSGDRMLNCQGNGKPEVIEACKTLRLK